MHDRQFQEIRAEIDCLGPTSPSRRYPPALKTRIVAWVSAQRIAGAAAGEISAALGIPWESLGRWLREQGAGTADLTAPLRPVRVLEAPAEPPRTLSLRSPRGFIVEGLDVPSLVELLERLG